MPGTAAIIVRLDPPRVMAPVPDAETLAHIPWAVKGRVGCGRHREHWDAAMGPCPSQQHRVRMRIPLVGSFCATEE